MKNKLVLILPQNKRSLWGGVSKSGKAGFIRLSLPTIAALTPSDWEVEILDSRTTKIDYDMNVDLVGITAYTAEIPDAYEIADRFREKGVKVVMGGIHVSALPDEALQHADSVVIGEAESVWENVLNDCKNGSLKKTYKPDSLIDMAGMKTPRRDLLDRNMFTSFHSLQASRGCPHKCEYCTVTAFFGNKYRTRPVSDVIREIKDFDSKDFFFIDDNITGKPKYAKELFRELKPLGKAWGGQTTINIAKDDELLELYAGSGGKYAFIGIETLSEGNLQKMNKSWNSPNGYKKAISKIHDAGINIVGSFIFGLDNDDPSVFEKTFQFIMDNGIDAAQFHILTPFPGTELYSDIKTQGRITDNDWAKYHTGEVIFQPKGMTADELQQGYWWIHHKTYETKNIIRRVLRSPRNIIYRVGANLSYRNKARKMPDIKL